MQIGVPRETAQGEARVALTPDVIPQLVKSGHRVMVERGAGDSAGFTDEAYRAAQAEIVDDPAALYAAAEMVLKIQRPSIGEHAELDSINEGVVLIGLLQPASDPEFFRRAAARRVTALSMELVPRTTRAQMMDALSSQSTVAGYKAVLIAANALQKFFPMLMTAAGTVRPARVLVIGAGVAGLQAIATARRLGAVVEAYDVRAAAGEQVKSLGATFLEVDLGGIQTEDKGGYAVELSEEALKRGRDLVAEHARTADVIVTTAQVPGRRAPILMEEAAVQGMKRGSVIIDLAGSTGGNVIGSQPDEIVERNGVTIMAPTNLAATVPVHASQLYSRNVTSFLNLLIKDGELNLDLNDNVLGPSCVTHQGQWVNKRVADLVTAAIK